MAECPICFNVVHAPKELVNGGGFDCPRCGRWCVDRDVASIEYWMSRNVADINDPQSMRRRSWFSHYLRRRQTDQSHWAKLPLDFFKEGHEQHELLPTPAEQFDNLILWLGQHQATAAESVIASIPEVSAWIGASIIRFSSAEELDWLLQEKSAQALLYVHESSVGHKRFRLNLAGWTRYEQLKRSQVETRRVLMAMKFKGANLNDPELDLLVKRFTPAVKRAGFYLYTIEQGPAGSIDDQLRVALRTSRFIISDLTHGSRGAYWEAGFVEGLGRPVIYTCRRKEWEDEGSHFDTNHLRTIVWETSHLDDAASRLTAMIRVTLPEEAIMND